LVIGSFKIQKGGVMGKLDDLILLTGHSNPEFADKIGKILGVSVIGPDDHDDKGKMITRFSNDNFYVCITRNVRGKPCYPIQTMAPPVNDNIMEYFLLIRALKEARAGRITAVMPYMPYIRSDKRDRPRACIGAKLFCDLLERAGIDEALIMEPHFDQIAGYFNVGVNLIWTKNIWAQYIKEHFDLENAVIVAPDLGESKHVGPMANTLNLPDIAVIDKRRIGDTEKVKSANIVGVVKGKICFIFDDETASGETLLQTADICMQQEALEVYAFVTHGVLCKMSGVKKLHESKSLKKLVITDTMLLSPEKQGPKIEVVSVASEVAASIKIIHEGGSLEAYNKAFEDRIKKIKRIF
jgi:ribose-phosphate pyrophosphokinase